MNDAKASHILFSLPEFLRRHAIHALEEAGKGGGLGEIMAHQCENCKLRANYDKKPNSLMGRFWRWHINFCPGWKAYFTSLPADQQQALREKYQFTKYSK